MTFEQWAALGTALLGLGLSWVNWCKYPHQPGNTCKMVGMDDNHVEYQCDHCKRKFKVKI